MIFKRGDIVTISEKGKRLLGRIHYIQSEVCFVENISIGPEGKDQDELLFSIGAFDEIPSLKKNVKTFYRSVHEVSHASVSALVDFLVDERVTWGSKSVSYVVRGVSLGEGDIVIYFKSKSGKRIDPEGTFEESPPPHFLQDLENLEILREYEPELQKLPVAVQEPVLPEAEELRFEVKKKITPGYYGIADVDTDQITLRLRNREDFLKARNFLDHILNEGIDL
ncbi:hypothetical protein Ab1vBOLIVR5_gp247 [Agrobacterium phage OLIVR5]|uniref:Uncharacterized protein n=1 Tax=Agrobacterium phage OLIVR5 TaxID=2723773 RepID=A0A858MZB3_9CAUD|nr:hypothetical protein KNU99_gp154 [Agrobacterium phage OLIVR5]QIW87895.1 hypothetical protein Ab1vBOLIVR5_gp247 [Agrobacterium phage OLIVR5]QIW88160.1 hypothetical protein Ab1vBOLIVR6_gp253 [Agrobacterium phage OLIVR6]